MAALMRRHFWFRGTRRVILDWARIACGGDIGSRYVADIGCGTGPTLSWLEDVPNVVGVDLSSIALGLAREATGASLVQGNACTLPLADGAMDMVLALDMFEHLETPQDAAREIFRALKPGGWLVATVPAWPFLASQHDVALGHYRRYRKPGFHSLLAEAGFQVDRVSYYNFFLFPAVASVRLLRSESVTLDPAMGQPDVESDLKPVSPVLNRCLEELLAVEKYLLRVMNLPFGVSLIARAQRPV